ncbi:hypothetical protein Dxin01_00203 [Deinococcus xinjiangensis]|uniref:Uncharacterized protein n=1 Tax=Deinococcus xinjiangensis TaxID=457454 RepID=A0ABP9V9W8_9DEIO
MKATFQEVNTDATALIARIDALLPQAAGTAAEKDLWERRDAARMALRIVYRRDTALLPKAAAALKEAWL